MCMALPALDALSDSYGVYAVVEVIGGTSVEAQLAGLERVVQASARPVTWSSLAGELQRDRAQQEAVEDVTRIVLTERLLKE
jgi:hypothetical protein